MSLLNDHKPQWRGYTWVQLQRCAMRELQRRKTRYPGYVNTHRMTLEAARQEIDMMRVIAEVMAELAESERLI